MGPDVSKIFALNFQNVSINYIGWISIGNISRRYLLSIMSAYLLPLWILGNFQIGQIVATVFKPFCFLLNLNLYCIVLYCIVLYCIVLYCIVLYCIYFSFLS